MVLNPLRNGFKCVRKTHAVSLEVLLVLLDRTRVPAHNRGIVEVPWGRKEQQGAGGSYLVVNNHFII
jgi:hypothetical protein